MTVVDGALERAYAAIWRFDEDAAIGAIGECLRDPSDICEVAQKLALGVAGVIKQAGDTHRFHLDPTMSDDAAETVAAIIVAKGNRDPAACSLVHQLTPQGQVEVVSALLTIVAAIAAPVS